MTPFSCAAMIGEWRGGARGRGRGRERGAGGARREVMWD